MIWLCVRGPDNVNHSIRQPVCVAFSNCQGSFSGQKSSLGKNVVIADACDKNIAALWPQFQMISIMLSPSTGDFGFNQSPTVYSHYVQPVFFKAFYGLARINRPLQDYHDCGVPSIATKIIHLGEQSFFAKLAGGLSIVAVMLLAQPMQMTFDWTNTATGRTSIAAKTVWLSKWSRRKPSLLTRKQ